MDITNPLRSIAPTVDADVLAVLAGSHEGFTGLRIQQLAGRSYAQVREVLHRLVDHGLVDAVRHGRAVTYALNRDHVLAPIVGAAVGAAGEIEARLRADFEAWARKPGAVVLFGSFARHDGGPQSDVDVLLVRPDEVTEDDEMWLMQRYDLTKSLERWTGNSVQIVELSWSEFRDAVSREDELVVTARRDGRALVGPPLRDLMPAP